MWIQHLRPSPLTPFFVFQNLAFKNLCLAHLIKVYFECGVLANCPRKCKRVCPNSLRVLIRHECGVRGAGGVMFTHVPVGLWIFSRSAGCVVSITAIDRAKTPHDTARIIISPRALHFLHSPFSLCSCLAN